MKTKRLLRLLPALCLAVGLLTVCALAADLQTGSNALTIAGGATGSRYTFTTTEGGIYRFRSEGGTNAKDPAAQLYLGDTLLLENDNISILDGHENYNFRFSPELATNTTYTLKLVHYDSEGGYGSGTLSVTLLIEKAEPVTVTSWDTLRNALSAGGYVTLGQDVAAGADSSELEVPADVTAVLDLNGHSVNGSALRGENTDTLFIEGALILLDGAGGGRVTAPNDGNFNLEEYACIGAVNVGWDGGSLVMNSGTISGSFSVSGGEGDDVKTYGVWANGRFDMNGGTVSAAGATGGAVYLSDENCVFTLTDGTISASGAASCGVYVDGGEFRMQGGTVSAPGTKCGVYVGYEDKAVVSGGTISASGSEYGGVYVYVTGELQLAGAPVIESVYLWSDQYISFAGPLTGSVPIPVITQSTISASNPVRITSGLPENGTAACFISADARYAVFPNGDDEAELRLAPVPYVDENGEMRTATNYQIIEQSNLSYGEYWNGAGCYVILPGSLSGKRFTLGDSSIDEVTLILCDGASLELSEQFTCYGRLTVYGQEEGTGSLCVDTRNNDSPENYAINIPNYPSPNAPSLIVNGGSVAGYGGSAAAVCVASGCTVNCGMLTASGREGIQASTTVNGGAISFSSVFYSDLQITKSFTVNGGTDLKPAAAWKAMSSGSSLFNSSGYAGKTLRIVDVTGVWGADDTLVASVSAPGNALLLAAAYDEGGRLTGARAVSVSGAARVRTGLPQNGGWTYRLMLADQNYAPLIPAWKQSVAGEDVK